MKTENAFGESEGSLPCVGGLPVIVAPAYDFQKTNSVFGWSDGVMVMTLRMAEALYKNIPTQNLTAQPDENWHDLL